MNLRVATQHLDESQHPVKGIPGRDRFALVTTVKNEGPYILEWVAYHIAIGFTDIIIYQNGSVDHSHLTLRTLRRIGAITYFRNDNPPRNYQIRAYRRAGEEPAFRQADWAIALDLDEFLVVKTGNGTVQDYVRALPDADEVQVNWRLFGSAGHSLPSAALVTERFDQAEARQHVSDYPCAFKTLFRPKDYERPGIHRPRAFDDAKSQETRIINGSGLAAGSYEINRYRSTDPKECELAQINHYAVRDAGSYLLKTYRGRAHQDHNPVGRRYWRNRDLNQELDQRAANMAEKTRLIMDDLDAQSGGRLYHLRRKSLETHLDMIEDLLGDAKLRSHYLYFLGRR